MGKYIAHGVKIHESSGYDSCPNDKSRGSQSINQSDEYIMTLSTKFILADGFIPGLPNTAVKDTIVVKRNRYITIDALQELIN